MGEGERGGMRQNGSRVDGCVTGWWAYYIDTILFNLYKFEIFHNKEVFFLKIFLYIKNILSNLVSSSETEYLK